MLLYLYNVTLNLFITATVVTVFYALSSILMGRAGKLAELGGIVLGVLIALYRAVRHAFLSTRDLEINLYTFYIGITLMALMLLAMPISGSIGHGIGLGMISYTGIRVLQGRGKEVSLLTYIISILFLVKFFVIV